MKAGVVHRQHRQVEALLILGRIAIKARTRRHVRLDTKDRLDASLFGSFIIVKNTTHRTMVGYCRRLHTELLDLVNQIIDFSQTIQHRMKGVVMQVHEIARLQRRLALC